jgi:hypothetical protein
VASFSKVLRSWVTLNSAPKSVLSCEPLQPLLDCAVASCLLPLVIAQAGFMLCAVTIEVHSSFDFCFGFLCGLLQGVPDMILESPDQKTRGFVVQIALPR